MMQGAKTIEFHLTPQGWVSDKARADEVVETWSVATTQLSFCTPAERQWINVWRSERHPRAERDRLREHYPFPDEVRPHPMRNPVYASPLE